MIYQASLILTDRLLDKFGCDSADAVLDRLSVVWNLERALTACWKDNVMELKFNACAVHKSRRTWRILF